MSYASALRVGAPSEPISAASQTPAEQEVKPVEQAQKGGKSNKGKQPVEKPSAPSENKSDVDNKPQAKPQQPNKAKVVGGNKVQQAPRQQPQKSQQQAIQSSSRTFESNGAGAFNILFTVPPKVETEEKPTKSNTKRRAPRPLTIRGFLVRLDYPGLILGLTCHTFANV